MAGLKMGPEEFRIKNRTLWILAMIFSSFFIWTGTADAQSAARIVGSASDLDLKSEATVTVGPALPSGHTRSFFSTEAGTSRPFPQGMKTGCAVSAGYRYFVLPQLSLGASFSGHWYGYDYQALDLSSATRVRHSGWGMYGLTAVIGARLPLGLYGLYFTADVQCGYALMCSPSVSAVYSNETVGDTEMTILRSSKNGNLYVSGGAGVQYRIRRHWLCNLNFSYSYMPVTKLGSDQPVRPEGSTDMRLKLSSVVVSVGAAYAF